MSAWLKALTLQDLARKRQLYLQTAEAVTSHKARPSCWGPIVLQTAEAMTSHKARPSCWGPMGMPVGQVELHALEELLVLRKGRLTYLSRPFAINAAGTTP